MDIDMDIERIDRECLIQPSSHMDIEIFPTHNFDEHGEIVVEENSDSNDGSDVNGLEVNSGDELECIRESIMPEEGMLFSTQDEAYKFYNRYALKKGFGTRKWSTYASKSDKSKIIGRRFVCDKQGKRRSLTKGSVSIDGCYRRQNRTECKAMMSIRLNELGKWKVSMFIAEHNHEMSTPSKTSKHRSHKKSHRQPMVKNLITRFHGEGMSNAGIARAVNTFERDQTQMITSQQVHDHLRIERKNNMGKNCAMVVKHFMNKKVKDPSFFFSIELHDDYTLRSVFWADKRSQEAYLKFSDVIIFDVTYRTNNFSLPFAPFTGINHHRQSTLFGCALLADETESTFVWLFQQWLTCMGGKEPTVIITDQDAAMGNAIARVFPNTLHRFCEWHLERNIAENLAHLKTAHGEDIELDFVKLRNSDSVDEAKKCWNELMQKYELKEKSWLPKLWERRKSWLHCYLMDTFVAGTRSSQRSESINSFFDTYVNATTPLHEFVVQYDKALASRRRAEEDEDFKTMNTKPVNSLAWSLVVEAGKVYTAELFKLLLVEMVDALKYFAKKKKKEGTLTDFKVGLEEIDEARWRSVSYDSNGVYLSCSCKLFETHGLLCRHAFCILRKKCIAKIPDRYILKRWSIECRHQSMDVEFREDFAPTLVDSEQVWGIRYKVNKVLDEVPNSQTIADKFDTLVSNFLEEMKLGTSSQVGERDLSLSQSTGNNIPEITIRDPTESVKTKGRPKAPSRLQSSLEKSQAEGCTKKRTCGHCGGKGHYKTGCPILKEAQRKK